MPPTAATRTYKGLTEQLDRDGWKRQRSHFTALHGLMELWVRGNEWCAVVVETDTHRVALLTEAS